MGGAGLPVRGRKHGQRLVDCRCGGHRRRPAQRSGDPRRDLCSDAHRDADPASVASGVPSVYSQLQSSLRRADVAASPMWAYFPRARRQCDFQFFAGPGGTTYNHVEVNDRRACGERLVFQIPGGVQPGRWVVGIDLEESELRIPFDLS